jgi:hypothetical protein
MLPQFKNKNFEIIILKHNLWSAAADCRLSTVHKAAAGCRISKGAPDF